MATMTATDDRPGASTRRAVAALLCLAAPACAPSQTHYVLASTGTVIGVEVAQHPANQTPQAKLGYNRSETAMVPTARPPCAITEDGQVNCGSMNSSEKLKDLPNVLMELRYGGIFDLGASSGIYQRLAVGSTAVAQDGATAMFVKDAAGQVDPETAATLARANLFRTIGQAEYEAMVAEARQELDVTNTLIDDIIESIRREGDPSKVNSERLKQLAERAGIDTSRGKASFMIQLEETSDLRGFLQLPAKEFVEPMHQSLS
jgi:hypothetical protein